MGRTFSATGASAYDYFLTFVSYQLPVVIAQATLLVVGSGLLAIREVLDDTPGKFCWLASQIGMTVTILAGATMCFYLVDEALITRHVPNFGRGAVQQYFEVTVGGWAALVLLCGAAWSFAQFYRRRSLGE